MPNDGPPGMPVPCYAVDDQTAIEVVDGAVEVVSEGHWKLRSCITPCPQPRIRVLVEVCHLERAGDTT